MSDDRQSSPGEGKPRRRVRSFVLRTGRITPGQRRALEELWPEYGLDSGAEPFDFSRIFGRTAPVVLEIGFGNSSEATLIAPLNGVPARRLRAKKSSVSGICLMSLSFRLERLIERRMR